jgi:hypothetical protein
MTGSAHDTKWVDGVEAVTREAAGAVEIAVIMQSELLGLLNEARRGNPSAEKLLNLTAQTLARIEIAPRGAPMLCACCPRPVRPGGRFNIAVAIPARDDPRGALSLAVCGRCASTPQEVSDKALEGLRRIWPDLRTLAVTHPQGGRA